MHASLIVHSFSYKGHCHTEILHSYDMLHGMSMGFAYDTWAHLHMNITTSWSVAWSCHMCFFWNPYIALLSCSLHIIIGVRHACSFVAICFQQSCITIGYLAAPLLCIIQCEKHWSANPRHIRSTCIHTTAVLRLTGTAALQCGHIFSCRHSYCR